MAILLFLLWILLNGRLSADMGMVEILISGVLVTALVCLLVYKAFGLTIKSEIRACKRIGLMVAYAAALIWEMIKANLSILPIILKTKQQISPCIIKIQVPLKSNFARVILANSITLTPGTLTIDIEDDIFTVHCLDGSFASGMEDSNLVKLLERIEK